MAAFLMFSGAQQCKSTATKRAGDLPGFLQSFATLPCSLAILSLSSLLGLFSSHEQERNHTKSKSRIFCFLSKAWKVCPHAELAGYPREHLFSILPLVHFSTL
jgi:hypothetical protein